VDPFAQALDAIFVAPGSTAAIYSPVDGEPFGIRVIRSQPDETVSFGSGQVILETNIFQIRRSDVAHPDREDRVILGGELVDGEILGGDPFKLSGEPMLDTEGLTWTVGASPLE